MRKLYHILLITPLINLPLLAMSQDFMKGVLPDWVYNLFAVNYILAIGGTVIYLALTAT